MDFFQIAFESLPVVASHPFSFIAYLTVLLCWLIIAYKIKRNKQLLLNIDKLPEKDRIKAIELEMGAVKVSSNLTADQWVKSRIHFYYLIGFSIVCFLVLLIFVISIVSSSGIYDDVKEEKQIYYEIILDTSKVMEEEIDGEEKFDIAIDLIGKIKSIVSSDDNLALRVFGGPCGGGNTKLLLRFNKHNVSKIYEEVNRVRLSGNTTIISALTEAISDFNNRQCSANSYKSIIIITGGMDSCFPDYLIEHMKNKIKKLGNDIEINFHIIGITDKKEHVVNLNTIAQLTGGKLWLANSKRNTSRVLNKISEFNLYLSGIREGSSVKISKKKVITDANHNGIIVNLTTRFCRFKIEGKISRVFNLAPKDELLTSLPVGEYTCTLYDGDREVATYNFDVSTDNIHKVGDYSVNWYLFADSSITKGEK